MTKIVQQKLVTLHEWVFCKDCQAEMKFMNLIDLNDRYVHECTKCYKQVDFPYSYPRVSYSEESD